MPLTSNPSAAYSVRVCQFRSLQNWTRSLGTGGRNGLGSMGNLYVTFRYLHKVTTDCPMHALEGGYKRDDH